MRKHIRQTRFANWFGVTITLFILLLLIFFTFFGDALYKHTTPRVQVANTRTVVFNGTSYKEVPASALIADSGIYLVVAEAGFSRTIYRLQYCPVSYCLLPELGLGMDAVYVEAELLSTSMVVVAAEETNWLKDGAHVLIR